MVPRPLHYQSRLCSRFVGPSPITLQPQGVTAPESATACSHWQLVVIVAMSFFEQLHFHTLLTCSAWMFVSFFGTLKWRLAAEGKQELRGPLRKEGDTDLHAAGPRAGKGQTTYTPPREVFLLDNLLHSCYRPAVRTVHWPLHPLLLDETKENSTMLSYDSYRRDDGTALICCLFSLSHPYCSSLLRVSRTLISALGEGFWRHFDSQTRVLSAIRAHILQSQVFGWLSGFGGWGLSGRHHSAGKQSYLEI